MHSERAPWYLRLATWGGVIFLHFPLLIIAIYAFNTEDAAFSFPPQGLTLRWFTPGAFVAPEVSFWRSVGYLMFPAVSIALPRIAMTVKMLKGSILTELERDYVRTSYSRGNSRRTTLYRHVLRNAVPATVTFLAMTVADIVAGSVVIEQVFAIPGLGRLLLSSISGRDYPVVQAVVVILAFWVVLVNLIADLINQRLDPRLRLS